jgi:hypothetical protein
MVSQEIFANTNSSPHNCGTNLGLEEVGQEVTYVRVSVCLPWKFPRWKKKVVVGCFAFNKWLCLLKRQKLNLLCSSWQKPNDIIFSTDFFLFVAISSPKWSDVCCPWIEDSGAFFNFAHMMYANIPRRCNYTHTHTHTRPTWEIFWMAIFRQWVLAGCQNIAGFLKFSLLLFLTCSQIWLLPLVHDGQCGGYITKLEKQKTLHKKTTCSSYSIISLSKWGCFCLECVLKCFADKQILHF